MAEFLTWTRRLPVFGECAIFCGMSTLAEIEEAVPRLSVDELAQLERFIRQARQEKQRSKPHSVLDLKPVHLGEMLRPLGDREEWYDEMREDRV